MTMTLPELQAARSALEAARFSGVRTVEYGDGRRVTYTTEAELAAALRDIRRQIAGLEAEAAGRPRRSRYRHAYASKGL